MTTHTRHHLKALSDQSHKEKRTRHQEDFQTNPSAIHLVLMRTRHLDSTCVILSDCVSLCVYEHFIVYINYMWGGFFLIFFICSLEQLFHKQLCWGHWFRWQKPALYFRSRRDASVKHTHTHTRSDIISEGGKHLSWLKAGKEMGLNPRVPHTHTPFWSPHLWVLRLQFCSTVAPSHCTVICGAIIPVYQPLTVLLQKIFLPEDRKTSAVLSPSIKGCYTKVSQLTFVCRFPNPVYKDFHVFMHKYTSSI